MFLVFICNDYRSSKFTNVSPNLRKKSELLYYNDENLMLAILASNRRQTAFRLRADLLACPPTLDFLKGLAGRLWDEFPHDEKIWNAHQGKEEEGAGRGERRHIGKKPWSELTDKVGAAPEGKSGNGHRDAADIVRIHLREEDENDGTDGNRAAEYIEQEEHKHEDAAELLREYEVEAYHQQGENHAGNLLALASHFVEGIYRALGLAADFGTDVPASEAVVLLAIHLPHLVNDMYRIS